MLRISIPYMPRTALTFAQDLSKLLLPMIGRPGGKLSVSLRSVTLTILGAELVDMLLDARGDCCVLLRCRSTYHGRICSHRFDSDLMYKQAPELSGRKIRRKRSIPSRSEVHSVLHHHLFSHGIILRFGQSENRKGW
jgi:hypothetical protein